MLWCMITTRFILNALKLACRWTFRNVKFSTATTQNHNFKPINKTNFNLLGSPITEDSINKTLHRKLLEFQFISSNLHRLPTHHAFTILKSSLGLCRLISTLRSTPCANRPIIEDVDLAIANCFESVVNIKLDENSRKQISLPIKMGGFGICLLYTSPSPRD